MENISAFLQELGLLHDAKILEFHLKTTPSSAIPASLEIKIDDMNANSAELPEYQGPRPCWLLFQGLQKIALNLDLFPATGLLHIFECSVSNTPQKTATIKLWPGGSIHLGYTELVLKY